jgi:hypothetical protein
VIDLSTERGVLNFCERQRQEMVRCFERLGRFEVNGYSFGAWVLATHAVASPPLSTASDLKDWKRGERLAAPQAMRCQMPAAARLLLPPDQHTKLFGLTLRHMNELSGAIGTVVMAECWHAGAPHVEGQTAQQARAALPDSLEDYDRRQEAMFLRLEHKVAGERFWRKAITRDPTRLGPWEPLDARSAGGYLVDLISFRN